MKKTDVVQPVAMTSAFAENVYSSSGTTNFEIPAATSTSADDTCVQDDGFLPITSTDLDDGGIAPERKNFNGLFYLSTDQRFYLQNGGFITYDANVATAIGGYPQDAILGYIDSFGSYKLVKSLIDDNTYNFITTPAYINGTYWEEIAMGGSSREIGEYIWESLPLVSDEVHLADGTLLQYGSYKAFIDYIASIYNSSLNYFCSEADWQASVTTYGSCGKFVYDSVNKTVRLPKVSDILTGITDVSALGSLVEAGLPNITGITRSTWSGGRPGSASGAFSDYTYSSGGCSAGDGDNGSSIGATFDASRSSSIYGNSTTVQPQTIKALLYIVIANTTKTAIEVDIDEIATDLNGKADTDLTNVNDSGTSRCAGWAMPSDTYKDLTLGASGTSYTAPANGWFCIYAMNSVADGIVVFTNGNGFTSTTTRNAWNGGSIGTNIAAAKGDTVYLSYDGISIPSGYYFRFYYAVGSESEAS